MENLGIFEVLKRIKDLNYGTFEHHYLFGGFNMLGDIIISDLDMSKLCYPTGYYYSEKNGVTNKHQSNTGMYESFPVFTLEEMK